MVVSKKSLRARKKIRIRKKINGTAERPRVAIFRSLSQIYASVIDDTSNKTLMSVSSLSKDLKDELKDVKGKIEVSKAVGKYLAKKALEKGINTVVFDRGGYQYHGRVKALAEGAREEGLKI